MPPGAVFHLAVGVSRCRERDALAVVDGHVTGAVVADGGKFDPVQAMGFSQTGEVGQLERALHGCGIVLGLGHVDRALLRLKGTLGILDMQGAAVARIEMQRVARRQLGSSVGCGQSPIREPARKTHAGVLIEVIVEVAVRFYRGRRGVVVCCMESGLSRLGKHNGLVIDAVGMVDDPDATDKQRRG